MERSPQNVKKSIVVNTKVGKSHLTIDEISFIKAKGRSSEIVLKDTLIITVNHPISWLEEKLPEDIFMRCHRSYIIKKQMIATFTCESVRMNHRDIIPVGRKHRNEIAVYLNG